MSLNNEHLKLFPRIWRIIYGLCNQLEQLKISIFCTSNKKVKVFFLAWANLVYCLICDVLTKNAKAYFDKSPLLFPNISTQELSTTFSCNFFIHDHTLSNNLLLCRSKKCESLIFSLHSSTIRLLCARLLFSILCSLERKLCASSCTIPVPNCCLLGALYSKFNRNHICLFAYVFLGNSN